MGNNMRKVWKTQKAGSIARLQLQEERLSPLDDDKIRVITKAVGLNFADIFALVGLYSATPKGAFIPGLEFSGVIESVGKDITNFSPGDNVMGVIRFGAYASVIDILPIYCQKLPDSWSFSEGAAYIVQTLTAWYALKTLGDVKKESNVLVHSAAGGVGLQAMKLCKAIGAYAIGTVSREEKKNFLQKKDLQILFFEISSSF